MRRTFALSALSLFVVFSAGSSIGCDTEEAPPADNQPTEWKDPEGQEATWKPDAADHTEWKFKDTTTYIKSPRQNLVTVADSSLTLPAADFQDILPLAPGDVLIGNGADDGSLKNPTGFLRKVVSVTESGADIVITTEAATLADAFETCDMAATWDLPSYGDMVFVDESDGSMIKPANLGPPTEVELEASGVNFNAAGTVLFNQGGLKATVSKGSFSFTPSFHFELDAGLLKGLQHFEAVATGTTSAELEVTVETTQAIDKDISKTFSAPSIPIPVGPLTAFVTPRLTLGCSLDVPLGSSIAAGAKAVSVVSLGVEYDKATGFHGIAESDFTLNRLGPTLTLPSAATARCFIRPELGLSLVDNRLASAGANLAVEGYAQIDVTKTKFCTFDATVGVKGTIGVALDAIGFDPLSKDLTLFDKSVKLVDNGNCSLGI
ncbi:MAG: hypothetical protein U0414_18510 [Polyangiaceae bacterium]